MGIPVDEHAGLGAIAPGFPCGRHCAKEHVSCAPELNYESDGQSDDSALEQSTTVSKPENPLRLRESAIKRPASIKGQKICCYQMCPSPLHSKKWRVVTMGTSAGGRDWEPLVGQTLCDSCYSTYRKHGTFIRSVRTTEGWSRVDSSGSQPANTIVNIKPKKPTQAPVKRHRVSENPDAEMSQKRHDRKPGTVREDFAVSELVQVCQCVTIACLGPPPPPFSYAAVLWSYMMVLADVQSDDGQWQPRPCRSRKPSAKIQDMLQAASTPSVNAKRARKGQGDDALTCQERDFDGVQLALPENVFDDLNTVDRFCVESSLNERYVASELSSVDFPSSEVCMQALLEEDFGSSASEEEFMDRLMDLNAVM
jgi:hypothetical protein